MATSSPTSYAQLIAQDLRQRYGLNNAGIAAFLGNFQEESGITPWAYNAGEGAHGFAQWENGRFTALAAIGRRLGVTDWTSHAQGQKQAQAEIIQLNHELDTGYSGVIAALRQTTDVNTAAQIVQSRFEVSDPSTLGIRQGNARTFYSQLQAGTLKVAGGTLHGITGGAGLIPKGAPPLPFDPSGNAHPGALTGKIRAEVIAWIEWARNKKLDLGPNAIKLPSNAVLQKADTQTLRAWFDSAYYDVTGTTTKGKLKPNPITQAIEDAAAAILGPIGKYMVDAFFVIAGALCIILAFVLLAHDAGASTPSASFAEPENLDTE